MSKQHDPWLAWKLKHGLAAHGRPAPLRPKGVAAKILYHAYFKFKKVPAREETGAIRFTQTVGGSLGATGTLNGE